MASGRDGIFGRVVDYFQSSRFDYLALDYAGGSLRLSREPATHAGASLAATSTATTVLATSVGFVELPGGRQRLAEAGEHVEQGEAVFAIRRFRDVVVVSAPTSGTVESVLVKRGDFVDFGQPLATFVDRRSAASP